MKSVKSLSKNFDFKAFPLACLNKKINRVAKKLGVQKFRHKNFRITEQKLLKNLEKHYFYMKIN